MLEAMLEHSKKQLHGSENEVQDKGILFWGKMMVEGREMHHNLTYFENSFAVFINEM